METILNFLQLHAQNAHWIFFCLIILGGLNLPISEDSILLLSGAIAARYLPDHTLRIIIWVFVGCVLAAWMTYWIGRLLGPKLYQYEWFNRILSKERTEKIKAYFVRYGIGIFLVVRFLPGGVRNALFLTSGFTKMPFYLFVLRDGLALLTPFSLLFTLGYLFGTHFDLLLHYFKVYDILVLSLFILIVALIVGYSRIIKRYWSSSNKQKGTKD